MFVSVTEPSCLPAVSKCKALSNIYKFKNMSEMLETGSTGIMLYTQIYWRFLSLTWMQLNNSFILFLHLQEIVLFSIADMQIKPVRDWKGQQIAIGKWCACFFKIELSSKGCYEGHSKLQCITTEKNLLSRQNLGLPKICLPFSPGPLL